MPPQRRWLECWPRRRTEDGFHAEANPTVIRILHRARPLARPGHALAWYRQLFAGRRFIGTPRARRLLLERIDPRPDREEATKDAARSLSRTDCRDANQPSTLDSSIGQNTPELLIHAQQTSRQARNWSLPLWLSRQAVGAVVGIAVRKLFHPFHSPHQASSPLLGSRTPRSARTDVGDLSEVARTQIGRCDVGIPGHHTATGHRRHSALSYGEKSRQEGLTNSVVLTKSTGSFKIQSAVQAAAMAVTAGFVTVIAVNFVHAEGLEPTVVEDAAVVAILEDFRTCVSEAAAVTTPEIVPDMSVRQTAFETIVQSCKGSRDARLRGVAADARAEEITNSIIKGAKAEIGLGS